MPDWLSPLAGVLVLLALGMDVFQTAFHAEGRGGPINRRQNRLIWRLVRWAGTVGGDRRGGILSLGGPLMAIATITVWSVLLLAGFVLIYLPYVLDFHYSSGQAGPALLEAFYYSGIIAATLGQGDVVAPGAALRVVTVLQAVSGFALVTVAVTYVLAVYRELVASQALAAALDARLAQPDPPGVASRNVISRSQSHFNYPILHYFRPDRSSRALPPQVARLLAAARRLEEGSEEETGSSSHRALRGMIRRYIGEVHSLFVRQAAEPDEDPEREWARLRQILHMMAYDDPVPDGQ